MRLEVVTPPEFVDGGVTDSLTGRHQPATPLGHSLGLGTQHGIDDCLDLLRTLGRFATMPRCHLP